MEKIETDIFNFDKISGGGLLIPAALALIGNVGSIKEIFVRQIVWNFLQKRSKVLYYSVSQSAEDLRNDMARFKWDVTEFEKEKLLHIEDVFTDTAEKALKIPQEISSNDEVPEILFNKDLYDLKSIVRAGVKFMPAISGNSKPRLIIFDSISPILTTNAKGVFQLLHTLKFATRFTKAIGIGLMHTGMHEPKTEQNFKSLGDGVIEIVENPNGSNTIFLDKYIGEYKKGPFPIEINSKGIDIFPITMIEFPSHEHQINV
ncbi:MAG: hypothetical protein QG670_806 [Thermoproteota archaeon]|nr:hypothetical protein [Thermoproteota archaeon]